MKKRLAALLVVAMMVNILVACSGTSASSPSASASSPSASPTGTDSSDGWHSTPDYVLSYADQNAETADLSVYSKAAADKVYQETKGAVKIDCYYSESLVKYSEMLSGVCQGMCDISYMISSQVESSQTWPLIWERLYPTGAPTIDKLSGVYSELLTEVPEIQKEMEAAGGMWLTVDATPGRHVFSSKGFYLTPDSMKGKNIGANGSDLLLYNLVGASGVKLATSERYSSLQTGLIEAYSTHYPSWASLSLGEVTNYVTEFGKGGLQCQARGFVVNLKTWNSLPTEYQDIIKAAYEECTDEMTKYDFDKEQSVRSDAIAKGLQVHTLTADEMAVWAPYIEEINQDWIKDATTAGNNVQYAYDLLLKKVAAIQ